MAAELRRRPGTYVQWGRFTATPPPPLPHPKRDDTAMKAFLVLLLWCRVCVCTRDPCGNTPPLAFFFSSRTRTPSLSLKDLHNGTFVCRIWYIVGDNPLLLSYGHTQLNPPHPVRSAQLNSWWQSQYYGGGPHGNTMCCNFYFLFFYF